MKIGIIGAGMIGGTLGALWRAAGHEIYFGTRHPARVDVSEGVDSGSPMQAAAFGDVVLLAVPMGAMPLLATQIAEAVARKTVLDAGNVFAQREPRIAEDVARLGRGSGRWVAGLLPRARVVKAFNTVYFETLRKTAGTPQAVGVPLAGDEGAALEQARVLVADAGFEPVVVGALDRAKEFDAGTPAWNSGASAAELRRLFTTAGGTGAPPA